MTPRAVPSPNQSANVAVTARRERRSRGRTVSVPRTEFVSPKRIAEDVAEALQGISEGIVAQAADCTKDTAQSYKLGRRAPSSAKLLNMARSLPTVAILIAEEIDDGRNPIFRVLSILRDLAKYETPEGRFARGVLLQAETGG